MLVLSRKVGESIRIGDEIEITVNRISGNRVTIGVSAPRDVRILRGEVEVDLDGSAESEGALASAIAQLSSASSADYSTVSN